MHFTHQMLNGCDRMIQDHSRPRPAHNRTDALLHLQSVAMNRTHLTSRLRIPITATVKPALGVLQQLLATRAKRTIALFPPTIQTYHLLHYTLLLLYASHFHRFQYIESLPNADRFILRKNKYSILLIPFCPFNGFLQHILLEYGIAVKIILAVIIVIPTAHNLIVRQRMMYGHSQSFRSYPASPYKQPLYPLWAHYNR